MPKKINLSKEMKELLRQGKDREHSKIYDDMRMKQWKAEVAAREAYLKPAPQKVDPKEKKRIKMARKKRERVKELKLRSEARKHRYKNLDIE